MPEIKSLRNEGIELHIIPLFARGKLRADWGIISENYYIYQEKLLSIRILFSFLNFVCFHPVLFYKNLLLLKESSFSQFIKNLTVLPKSIWISNLISKEKPDHIHAHWGNTTSTAVMLATNITLVPWSFTCHRWDIYENNLLGKKSESANFVRFISNKGKSDSLQFNVQLEKSIVIPMGTEIPKKPNFPIWRNDGEEFIIICPANLIPVKGHIYLINAIDKLIKERYKIKLLLAGEGMLKKEIQAVVKEYGIENNVIFLGHLLHNDLLDLYINAKIHLLVLPSVDLGNGEHEGIPVSLMEAMSYGIPVISTDTGSINELLPKEIGLTVPHKNADELAQKIKQIYNNPDCYKSTSKLCRKIIEEDWNVNMSAKKLILMMKNYCNFKK